MLLKLYIFSVQCRSFQNVYRGFMPLTKSFFYKNIPIIPILFMGCSNISVFIDFYISRISTGSYTYVSARSRSALFIEFFYIYIIINSCPEFQVFATSIEPVQLAHPCSLTRLHTVGWSSSSCHLDIPKDYNGLFQKWKVDHLRNPAG